MPKCGALDRDEIDRVSSRGGSIEWSRRDARDLDEAEGERR